MSEHKPLYIWSLESAESCSEQDLWSESYKENCDCARAIEKAIDNAYDYRTSCLNDCAKPIIEQYGFDRVNWVLANTVQQKMQDGRFTPDNKAWARQFYIPQEELCWHFCVDAHPGLTDLFLNESRKLWQELGLFGSSQCESEEEGQLNYKGRVLVLRGDVLKDLYKTPEDQLFLAESGFGCTPNARDRKVFGKFLKDGEEANFQRSDFIGVLKNEHLPEWAKEKLAELQPPEETEKLTIGGI